MVPLMQPTHLLVSQQVTPLSTTKIVTLPARATNLTSSGNGGNTGKIVSLPVGTVGKAGSEARRAEVHSTSVLKLNSNPPQGDRFGRFNGGPRFAQSMGGGFGRRVH